MKTKEELKALKEEYETVNRKLAELTEEELKAVTGGNSWNDYWGEDAFPGLPGHNDPIFPESGERPGSGGGNTWSDNYGEIF